MNRERARHLVPPAGSRVPADLTRLTVDGRAITREELLDTFQAIYKRAYNTGWQAGRASSSLEDARERGAA